MRHGTTRITDPSIATAAGSGHERTILMQMRTVVLTGLTLVLIAGFANGQQPAEQPAEQHRNFRQATSGSPMFWDIDVIMRPYLSLLTRYYNLNEEQEKYTRGLLTQRVKKFLGAHERDTRALFDEYLGYQMGGQLPPAAAAKEFANRAQPLLAAMYKEIIDGNMVWREILNDEQKKKHDLDLKAIDNTFKEFDAKFTRWAKGDIQPTDLPSTVGDQPRTIMKPEDAWQYYVRIFIVDYRLDEGQQATATSVLEELRKEAASYRLANKDEFAQLESQYQELTQAAPKTDPKELEAARKKREALDKKRERLEGAISVGMFNRLKQKLLTIPRSDQRESYEKRQADLIKNAERARAEFVARTSSQPAASGPASQESSSTPRAKAATRVRGNRAPAKSN